MSGLFFIGVILVVSLFLSVTTWAKPWAERRRRRFERVIFTQQDVAEIRAIMRDLAGE